MGNATISMMCNQSGWFNVSVASKFLASYDWSNNKRNWAQAKPMNDWELLLQQAAMTRAVNDGRRVFLYSNLVKALPWYSYVREKLEDPAYSGWFLRFAATPPFANGSYHVPQCDTTYDPPLCTPFYHDQEQSPAVPSPANPNPDGACVGYCDCGGVVPCGEYLWDHRNASLRPWLVETLVAPIRAGAADGWFLDDFFCSNIINGSCGDPVQGPSEIDAHSQVDMGLSDGDIADLTRGWLQTMTEAQAAILAAGGYTWSLIPGQDNANAQPLIVGDDAASCAATLRDACRADAPWQSAPLLFGLHAGNATDPLPFLEQDVAAFLLMRGPWAWAGYGVWGMSWPAGTSFLSPNGTSVDLPPQLTADYGVPVDPVCTETTPGVFTRRWTKAVATLDCTTWTGRVTMSGSA